MSAESPKRIPIHSKGNTGHVVLSQPVSDPSLIDSVAGFIQEVVPQAYTGSGGDSREVITWARVQQADVNDPAFYSDTGDQDGVPPLLLVLGYVSGVQVWIVPVSGEAREVLSWSQGSVRTMCVLPNPEPRLPLRQDIYRNKRPLVAMVDNVGPGPQFCSVTFISLRDGDQVKSIKFSHQVWDVVANRRSVVITLAERIAVFDSATLEDSVVVTTCYPSPDVNPIALGTRWLAYADRRLVSQWRSLGGCQGEGAQSVTATVFHAAKFLGKGLRDLSGTVASSLTGGSPENSYANTPEPCLKGIVTILDIDTKIGKDVNEEEHQIGTNRVLAHFNAHCEPIVALSFDPSGMLLISADKRGHRFHVFRINPHPCGSTLTYIQHLYILHRGDTTARIQDISFSTDSRWVAISSMRGTTHVFPITPYGGPVGVRTHTTPHVVNKLSRFHRSAGLSNDGRNSPVLWEGPSTPPLVHNTHSPLMPTTVTALAQIRRQSALAPPTEESIIRVAACFSAPRINSLAPHSIARAHRPIDSLYVMACNGSLIQYDLEPRHLSGMTKEKVCDDTSIELHVEAKAEWILQRPPFNSSVHPPLACTNPLLNIPEPPAPLDSHTDDDRWLSQVEIVTHAGPHRRLWMGPQFTFITINSANDNGDAIDINKQVVRSNPVNMPHKQALIIESGSCSSLELSPNMVELVYKTDCSWSCRLREDLAEAMMESPSIRNIGVKGTMRREPVIERQVNPLGSVVTLTTQLNFPGNLLSDDGKVTVVGTETKKITLESRFNKTVSKSNFSECLMGQTNVDALPLPFTESHISELDICNIEFPNGNAKHKVINPVHDNQTIKTSCKEVDENNSVLQDKVKDIEYVVGASEKKLKHVKSKRKVSSKGDKNKPKTCMDSKLTNSSSIISQNDSTVSPSDLPVCDEGLKGIGDIEMQLREASSERDVEVILPETDDWKGCKRSLDITTDLESSCPAVILEKSGNDLNVNEKTNLMHQNKSRINVNSDLGSIQDVDKNEEVKYHANAKEEESFESPCTEESPSKYEEKVKIKKKKTKKLEEIFFDDSRINKSMNLNCDKKTNNSEIEMLPEIDLCLNSKHSPVNLSYYQGDLLDLKEHEINAFEANHHLHSELVTNQLSSVDSEAYEINFVEEKSCTTDDELKGLESDLLVKDSAWSLDIDPEPEINTVIEDKDNDKVKHYETTDKDSSDDCQPLIVKSDLKQTLKKGKNRKMIRKNREIEPKMGENDRKNDDITSTEDLADFDSSSKDNYNDGKNNSCDDNIEEVMKKLDSEEDDLFVETKTDESEIKSSSDYISESKVSTDGVKRRVRKREEKSQETKDLDLQIFDSPKQSWCSIVMSNSKDRNGNVSKPEVPIASARTWSSVTAGVHKSKAQDSEVIKTNSVEDRDSVYESCNDSVGEEVEPAMDSLSSCYFESEAKDEKENNLNVQKDTKDEAVNESKSASSMEDKSNTDSGEKDDGNIGTQFSTKKSRKQKKKKR